ncbi:basic leucine zipper 6-like [Hibiscus syriacus]|uniref:basic leucine zipper 6-like n=1 Tax=Hibiscus syriacus TaxID=106335 RepID=UPI00192226A7|nr:basic leucine zipper 6-like [Hibiscus syriacus]
MFSKYETSTTPNDQMLSPDTEKSSISLENEESTLSLLSNQPPRALLHQRSASDSMTFVKKSHWVGPSSNITVEGCLEINGSGADGKGIDSYKGTVGDSSSASPLVTETHYPTQYGKWGQNFGPDTDPKKIKRLLANRVSAQKSRLKKAEYIENLKKDIAMKEEKVAVLAPAVSFYEKQRMMLEKENNVMKQRMETLEKEKAKKDD